MDCHTPEHVKTVGSVVLQLSIPNVFRELAKPSHVSC